MAAKQSSDARRAHDAARAGARRGRCPRRGGDASRPMPCGGARITGQASASGCIAAAPAHRLRGLARSRRTYCGCARWARGPMQARQRLEALGAREMRPLGLEHGDVASACSSARSWACTRGFEPARVVLDGIEGERRSRASPGISDEVDRPDACALPHRARRRLQPQARARRASAGSSGGQAGASVRIGPPQAGPSARADWRRSPLASGLTADG